MRIVVRDKKAELYFPYLKKGSELALIGQFESRKYKNQWIHEVVSESLLLLRNIDWVRGKSIRQQYTNVSDNVTKKLVNTSRQQSTNYEERQSTIIKMNKRDLMMITVDKAMNCIEPTLSFSQNSSFSFSVVSSLT